MANFYKAVKEALDLDKPATKEAFIADAAPTLRAAVTALSSIAKDFQELDYYPQMNEPEQIWTYSEKINMPTKLQGHNFKYEAKDFNALTKNVMSALTGAGFTFIGDLRYDHIDNGGLPFSRDGYIAILEYEEVDDYHEKPHLSIRVFNESDAEDF